MEEVWRQAESNDIGDGEWERDGERVREMAMAIESGIEMERG